MKKKEKQFSDCTGITEKVKFLLETVPQLRDNDMKLVSTFYFHQFGKDNLNQMTAFELLNKISTGEIPSFESISRLRRKIQSKSIELRGEFFHQKKAKHKYEFKIETRE